MSSLKSPAWIDRLGGTLFVILVPAMWIALWMIFLYAPDEKVMGAAQRIFYFHVPAAIMTFFGVFLLLAGSIAYLRTRNSAWDRFSQASTEISLLFCTLVLVTGPIWAKPAWGTWWTWEARLTTTLILWILLIAALIVRDATPNPDLGARLAAVVGIFAAVDVPIIHKAVEWWRGQHPQVFKPSSESSLAPKMAQTFAVSSAVFLLLFLVFVLLRFRALQVEARAQAFEASLETDS